MKIKRGSTSVRRLIFIADTSKTDGSGLANLVYNSSGLVAYYFAGDLNNEVQITLVTATLGTYASGGFVAVDNTNMPGWYEIGIPDAALDGGNEVAIQLRGATNMAPVNVYIELDTVDYQTDAFGALKPTTAGRTLDVTATGAAGIDWGNVENPTTTLNLSGTTISTTQQVASVSGRVTANTDQWGGVTVTGMPLPTASYTAPPSASTNATAVRTELTTELNRIDATISSRLATTSYTTPPTVGAIADAVWDESYSTHTTAGTFGKLMDTLRKSNTVIEGTILASPTPTTTVFRISGADYPTGALEHAILWMNTGASENQNSPILTTLNNGDGTVTVTLEEALVTAPSAGDTVLIDPTSHVHAIADIQAGLATAANLLIVSDRVSYSLAVLVGACSDAQTAAETYTLSIGGNTFTVDYTGLDSSGNRSTTTLSKT